jgi:hypothetical protein
MTARKRPVKPLVDPEDIRICECAECHCRIVGEASLVDFKSLPIATQIQIADTVDYIRVNGRPYCKSCYGGIVRRSFNGVSGVLDDISPWQENAIGDLEDAAAEMEEWG